MKIYGFFGVGKTTAVEKFGGTDADRFYHEPTVKGEGCIFTNILTDDVDVVVLPDSFDFAKERIIAAGKHELLEQLPKLIEDDYNAAFNCGKPMYLLGKGTYLSDVLPEIVKYEQVSQ